MSRSLVIKAVPGVTLGTASTETVMASQGSHIRLTALAGTAGIGVLKLEPTGGAAPQVLEDPAGSGNFYLKF